MVNVEKDIREYTGQELAYIGDAIWELKIREYFLQFNFNLLKLNKMVKLKVNAKYQSLIYKELLNNLEEEYLIIAKRAKNSNIKTFPKSCSVMEYKEATAFEAIIGAMYLKKDYEKINKILNKIVKEDENGIIQF